jgi:hypothetical protein
MNFQFSSKIVLPAHNSVEATRAKDSSRAKQRDRERKGKRKRERERVLPHIFSAEHHQSIVATESFMFEKFAFGSS